MDWLFGRKGQHLSDELFSSYLDGQVTSREGEQVEEHLATCQRCQEALAGLRSTVELMHRVPAISVPRSFVLSEVAQPAPRRALVPAWAVGAVASMAAALFAVIISADLTGLLAPEASPTPVAAPQADMAAEAVQVVVEKEVVREVEVPVPVIVEKEVIKEIAVEMPVAVEKEVVKIVEVEQPVEVVKEMDVEKEMAVQEAEAPSPTVEPVIEAVAAPVEAEKPTPVPARETGTPPAEEVPPRQTPAVWRIAEALLGVVALLLAGLTLWRLRRRYQQR